MNTALLTKCTSCKSTLPQGARFCAQCGKKLTATLNWQSKALICCLAVILWFVADTMAGNLAGPKPTQDLTQHAQEVVEDYDDPVLQRLRDNTKTAPNSIEAWQALSFALQEKISASEKPAPALIFEAIDALGQQLRLNPQDKQAMRLMADLSFEQQAFTKAVEYYSKYMQLAPEDLDTRAKYASSLAFVGRFEEALSELKQVLSKQPQHFHALAYMAITYAQMGDQDQALSYGRQALGSAPSPEAKQRFQAFLDTLQAQPSAAAGRRGNLPTEQQIVDLVSKNPVAGSKFVRSELASNGTLKLYFNEFPMQAMPPFAKDKFLGPIKNILQQARADKNAKLTAVQFVDQANMQVMEELKP